jgi:hypothetical protein
MRGDEPEGGATHDDILRAVHALSDTVGFVETDMTGQLIGKGLVAQVARLEVRVNAKFNWIDTLLKQAGTAVAIIAAAGVVIWWLAGPRMEKVFHEPAVAEAKK